LELTLPEGSAGRRLKCPRCGGKFYVGTWNPESGTFAATDRASSAEIAPSRPASSREIHPSGSDVELKAKDPKHAASSHDQQRSRRIEPKAKAKDRPPSSVVIETYKPATYKPEPHKPDRSAAKPRPPSSREIETPRKETRSPKRSADENRRESGPPKRSADENRRESGPPKRSADENRRPGSGGGERSLRELVGDDLLADAAGGNRGRAADAAGLFDDLPDPRAKTPSRPAPAEPVLKRGRVGGSVAGSIARQCPACDALIPAGESLCSACGFDAESGAAVPLVEEDFDETFGQVAAPTSIPFGVMMIGGISLIASVGLAIVAFLAGDLGSIFLGLICLFAVFASIQFLRGVTFKLLIVALSIGAAIDVVALIALPVVNANENVEVKPAENDTVEVKGADDADSADVVIAPPTERMDMNKISLGIGLLIAYAIVAFLLLTPSFRRYYDRS
jgi:hypothetical protein